jgi:hypothetical protein
VKKGQPGYRRFNKISGQFSARLIEMLESPAYRVLSLSARRVLDRIEIEHAHHGGQDNGRLPVTFNDFVSYGIDRHAVAPALRELQALGFVRITEHGRAGNAEFRSPNKFALTFRPTKDAPASDDWRRIKTPDEAEALAREARKPIKRPRQGKTENQCGFTPRFGVGNPHRKSKSPVGVSHTTGQVRDPTLLSISRGGDAALSPTSATRRRRVT